MTLKKVTMGARKLMGKLIIRANHWEPQTPMTNITTELTAREKIRA